ncbi:hypothetical protein SAMN04488505_102846 [Chitinophaga rupis]|uniref:Uncharacterized protein n=1 Tax=Chitinophaga rupis TaxID=573321 RepID=A0A1H7S752_9BACT|nr:hypothetical protein SAMN04488505_102846 [Chitinophaga rupis]
MAVKYKIISVKNDTEYKSEMQRYPNKHSIAALIFTFYFLTFTF